jgi:transposase
MPAPYSVDLRNKAVEAYKNGLGTIAQVAAVFSIGSATLQNYISQKKKTGSLEPKPATGGSKPIISGKKLDFVSNEVSKKPDLTLQELCDKFYKKFKIKVNDSMMCRALQSINYNRKKKSYFAAEQEREDVKKND